MNMNAVEKIDHRSSTWGPQLSMERLNDSSTVDVVEGVEMTS